MTKRDFFLASGATSSSLDQTTKRERGREDYISMKRPHLNPIRPTPRRRAKRPLTIRRTRRQRTRTPWYIRTSHPRNRHLIFAATAPHSTGTNNATARIERVLLLRRGVVTAAFGDISHTGFDVITAAVAAEEAVSVRAFAGSGRGACANALEAGAASGVFRLAGVVSVLRARGRGNTDDGCAGAGGVFAVVEDVAAGVV